MFDDPRVGLDKEPFVWGDGVIDMLAGDLPNGQTGFRLLFSATPFPATQLIGVAAREYGGNW